MNKKQTRTFAGIGALGAAALLLSGCGGNSFSKNTYGQYPNTLPYVYGQEPLAFYGVANQIGAQAYIEGSGLQDAGSSAQAYITGASAFSVTAAGTPSAALPVNVDPYGTASLPLGFSTNGLYVDSVNQTGVAVATVAPVAPGASVFFRAAIANGIFNNNAAAITGATLTSTDAQLASVAGLTAGLPMSLDVVGGAFSNATYVTGTGGTPTPFTIPASTTTGLHSVIASVTDNGGRTTATTFVFPVLASGTSGDIATLTPTPADAKASATVLSATATITSPVTGTTSTTLGVSPQPVNPETVVFAAPGSQTLTVTANVQLVDDTGKIMTQQTQTGTATVTLTAGQITFTPLTVAPAGAVAGSLRSHVTLHH